LAFIVLGAYTFRLKQQVNFQSVKLDELERRYSEHVPDVSGSSQEITAYSDVLQKLERDYMERKGFQDEPSYQQYRGKIESLLDLNINEIVNDEPLQGGKWFVTDVKFITPAFLFVSYEDGHELLTSLVRITQNSDGYSFQLID